MKRMTANVGVTPDKQNAILELREEGVALAHIILDAAELEKTMRNLARARSMLAEQVPATLDPGSRIDGIEASPGWLVPDHYGPADHHLLALRHSGFGWLGFTLEPERAKRIGAALRGPVPQPQKKRRGRA